MAGANCSQERGCGFRESGGVYLEVGIGQGGLPLEDFILDPPVLLDSALGVTPRGVTLVPQTLPSGEIVYHVADWIGSDNYPNVWDFLGEARLFGISRRLPKSLDFSKLSEKSRLLPCHARGAILNAERYCGNSDGPRFGGYPLNAPQPFIAPTMGGWKCIRGREDHAPAARPVPFCSGIWGQDIDGDELTDEQRAQLGGTGVVYCIDNTQYPNNDQRLVYRVMPAFQYVGRRAPEGVEPLYHPAFIATFPLTRIAVVQGHGDADALAKANAAKLPVKLVAE